MINKEEKWFPCPVCLRVLDVRTSKTKKPYVICSPCGVQMFIRERAGIEAFEALVEQGRKDNVLARVAEVERRCRLQCPQCHRLPLPAEELSRDRSVGRTFGGGGGKRKGTGCAGESRVETGKPHEVRPRNRHPNRSQDGSQTQVECGP
jgi:hypothetical protein